MSMQHTQDLVEFDSDVARYVAEYRRLKVAEAQLKESLDICRAHIEAALGDSTLGLVNGEPAVRFNVVESERFDVKKAREILPPQVIELLLKKSASRRFQVLDANQVF